MCKVVYLTSKRFDSPARKFVRALTDELQKRNVEVVHKYEFSIFSIFRRHRTYGIALAFDFYNDGKSGCGLVLNKRCTIIGRDFAYTLSNNFDKLTPCIRWRDFKFVNSDNKTWFKFFNRVSSSTKAIFYLCTKNNPTEWNCFSVDFDRIVKLFADEIIRCLRSNYDVDNYRKRVKQAKLKVKKINDNGVV